MIRVLCFLLCLSLAQLSWAYSCVEGHWSLDKDKSDNAVRLLKKLQKQEKKKSRSLAQQHKKNTEQKKETQL